ncbi:hypothetical protein B0H11DRAFT_858746 [Mycena galericulata]|nr:hypothetical protein B0H11DRAFT_858746 [Mycena galericulata]
MGSRYPSIPLTTHNHLPQEDRSRLIQSTRKIREVLGETPHFVDLSISPPPPPPPHQPLRSKKRSRHRYTPEAPPVPAAAPPPEPKGRPLLYIRVPDAPPPEHGPPTPGPPSPTLTVAMNLRNAAGYVVKDDAARRRKMAKLFRTLGVNVPTELVFPPPSAKERLARRISTRTMMSDHAESIRSVDGRRIERWRSGVAPTSPVRRRKSRTPSVKSKAESISHGWVWVGRPEEIPPHVRVRMRPGAHLPADWDLVEKSDIVEEPRTSVSTLRALHRREETWSGEWEGAVNMDHVVKSLRGLKVK